MERAKELFLKYAGNRFYMDHDGEGAEYAGYHISKETEAQWAEECVTDFLTSEKPGREALREYASAAELAGRGREADHWERCLYYPLRAAHLDDVTVLFMLSVSLHMAERAVKKHAFSRGEAETYLIELDSRIRQIKGRAQEGTLTRAADYVMQEFSDPFYTADYLDGLREKWAALLRSI